MVLVDFIKFLAKPGFEHRKIKPAKMVLDFLVLFVISLILTYGLSIVLQMFLQAPASSVNDLSFAKLVLFGLLLAPLFEELVFRLPMVYSKINLSVSVALAVASMLTSIFDLRLVTWFGGLVFFAVLCGFYILLNNHKSLHFKLEGFWKSNFAFVFYMFTFLFGMFHMANYQLDSISAIVLAFVFSVPQIIGALFLGFVRLRLGLWLAVLMHILFNMVPFGLMMVVG